MDDDLVRIYDAASLSEAQLLANRLKDRGVASHLGNATSPLAGLVAGEQTVAVHVLAADESRAREVAAEFERERAGEAAG